jgi:hypothetical protein
MIGVYLCTVWNLAAIDILVLVINVHKKWRKGKKKIESNIKKKINKLTQIKGKKESGENVNNQKYFLL